MLSQPHPQAPLLGRARGGDEDGVVARQRADDFGPVDPIERDGDALSGPDRGADDEQVRARRADIAHKLGNAVQHLVVAAERPLRQAVAVFQFRRPEVAQIAADARLRRDETFRAQQRHQLRLSADLMGLEQTRNGAPALVLLCGSAGHRGRRAARINLRIVYRPRANMQAVFQPVLTEIFMTGEPLECVVRGPEDPDLSVIWLHGLGADGHDFVPIVEELARPATRFVFPHAPVRPVTLNGGYPMRAWFDILALGPGAPQDEAGIRQSAADVRRLIDAEIARGVPSERIVLAGFSQGGAIALHTALTEPRPLAGVMGLSTFLPLEWTLAAEKTAANRSCPVFLAHGDQDQVVPIEWAMLGREALEREGYAPEWHVYALAHSVCLEEVRDIAAWLDAVSARAKEA